MTDDVGPQTVLDGCKFQGIILQLVPIDGVDMIKPNKPVPDWLAQGIRAHKPALVAHLKSVRPTEGRDRGDVPRCPNCHLASVILGDGSIRPCECGGVPA